MLQQDQIIITFPESYGVKESIQAHADRRGESVQEFILRAISETMYNDTHPRALDSEREARRRIISQYLGTE